MAAILILMELSYLLSIPHLLCILIYLLYCCCFYFYCVWNLKKNGKLGKFHASLPIDWPIIRMFPALFRNAYRIHEYWTEVLIESGGTFEFKGPWFANLDMVLTCDPANIHYILSKNFSNYPKGPEFRKIFEILGDGIFNADGELWEVHRKVTLSILHHPNFHKFLEKTLMEKLEKGLLPILDNYSYSGAEIDLQDIFQRLTFDSISRLVLDYDPNSLSMDLPNIPCEKAFNQTVEALLQRHILPETCWKLQKWMKIGKEKKLSEAWDAFDQFIYPCIDRKQQQLSTANTNDQYDGLTTFISAYKIAMETNKSSSGNTKLFLRDVFLNLMLAGRDTTSTALTWFFFLLAKNPSVEAKILQEIIETKKLRCKEPMMISTEESHKLVYLHGALCETLRLYPPVALEHKAPAKEDILPSGIRVNPNSKLVMFFYSMGRMESIWGEECLDFMPERWISERGKIRHEPSYKFPAFNAGPRTCLGKEMSFVQMKMVAASITYHYHVRLVDDHPVSPSDSIIIQMKHGLKVILSERI